MAKRQAKAPAPPEMTTYMLYMRNDTKKKVTVPTKWKVTFGALVPGSKDGSVNSGGATCLRFYDGTNQKAVFVGVESFRDMGIVIEEERVKTQQETFYRDTPAGKKQVVMEGAVREWVNPDKPSEAGEPIMSLPRPGAAVQAGMEGSRPNQALRKAAWETEPLTVADNPAQGGGQ